MNVLKLATPQELGQTSAHLVLQSLNDVFARKNEAHIIIATGASQFEFFAALLERKNEIDWSRITIFHLDEYIGIQSNHPASFRRYLHERFIDHLPNLKAFYPVCGDTSDPVAECQRLDWLIEPVEIDLACIGIGENGHIAFNDPPADFETTKPYLIVELDEPCRAQQWKEGWFPTLDDVPKTAISMSPQQILQSKKIICSVPDQRKAEAVRNTLLGPITNQVPASLLQQHPDCTLLLDRFSASLLPE